MSKEFERLQAAVGTLEQSKKDLFRAVEEAFPIGSRASYRNGDYMVPVTITGYGGGDRVKVHNKRAGKLYWVSFWRFFDRKGIPND